MAGGRSPGWPAWCSSSLFQPREYHLLGYFDLVFFVPEVVLLGMLARDDRVSSQPLAHARQEGRDLAHTRAGG